MEHCEFEALAATFIELDTHVPLGASAELPETVLRECVRDMLTAHAFDRVGGYSGLVPFAEAKVAQLIEVHGVRRDIEDVRQSLFPVQSKLSLYGNTHAHKATRHGVLQGDFVALVHMGSARLLYAGNTWINTTRYALKSATQCPRLATDAPYWLAKAMLYAGRSFQRVDAAKLDVPRRTVPPWLRACCAIIRAAYSEDVQFRKRDNAEARAGARMWGRKYEAGEPSEYSVLWRNRAKAVADFNAGRTITYNSQGESYDSGLAPDTRTIALAKEPGNQELAWSLFMAHARKPLDARLAWATSPTGALVATEALSCRGPLLKLIGGTIGRDGKAAIGRGVGTTLNGVEMQRATACLGLLLGPDNYAGAASIVSYAVTNGLIPWPSGASVPVGYVHAQRSLASMDAGFMAILVDQYVTSSEVPSLCANAENPA
jgi:hypothetical protein